MSTDAEIILYTEAQNQRQKEHDEIVKHLFVLKFLTKTLLECKPKRLEFPEDNEAIERALKVLRVQEYLRFNDHGNESLLNLGNYCENINLTYTEQKYVRKHLTEELPKILSKLEPIIDRIKTDLPGLFNEEESVNADLLRLEEQRREKMQTLAELKCRKIKLLKTALDLKLSPHVAVDLEILHAEMRLNQTKAKLMRGYIIHELISRSEHSLNAIKEVEGYIDKRLADQNVEKDDKKC